MDNKTLTVINIACTNVKKLLTYSTTPSIDLRIGDNDIEALLYNPAYTQRHIRQYRGEGFSEFIDDFAPEENKIPLLRQISDVCNKLFKHFEELSKTAIVDFYDMYIVFDDDYPEKLFIEFYMNSQINKKYTDTLESLNIENIEISVKSEHEY